ncbi:Integrase core domain protein [Novipirellula aureliae]|uniref:Integrase core domain protein n=1 Tax=Novipirellula aureliae TaxID=2527966 RepID=A0A5C6DLJ2_9BACT|nr:IS21 family transposase [Novipirellula aureliae]TWU36501.1 Integrase core domain protein [Novipirellula aureliae]
MTTDGQVLELRRWLAVGKSLAASARMASMDNKTARSYRDDERLPSERKSDRNYRTRIDPFAEVWPDIERTLQAEPRLKAKTLFDDLQRMHPAEFPDSTRRTFERRVAAWRSLHGPNKTVFFPQDHHPGRFAASDFTVCNELGVKIAGSQFNHSLFHCVLTYSNFESVSLCFSESFEALSEGIQNAFAKFGGVPQQHRTDSLSAAVRNHSDRTTLTKRYAALMDHYGCTAQRTNARCANENGDVESQNGHLKDRIDQGLLLRGSRDFADREDYMRFVQSIIERANANRQARFTQEREVLSRLPVERLDTDDCLGGIRVSKSSTITVRANTYSVPSRLIGGKVDVRISAETITVTHQGRLIQTMQRLVGKKAASINYRHVIDSLVRKPGAFADYRYREEMFPSSQFRFAYDMLRSNHSDKVADKLYLQILKLAADESQQAVEDGLRVRMASGEAIDLDQLRQSVADANSLPAVTDIDVEPPCLSDFDCLLYTFDKEGSNDDYDDHQDTPQDDGGLSGSSQIRQDRNIDDAVPRTSDADVPGSIRGSGDASRSGELESLRLSFGVDDAGVRDTPRRTDQTADDSFESSAGQELAIVSIRSLADECASPTGDTSRRDVSKPPGEHPAVWQTRFGKEPCLVRAGRATRAARPEHVVHDLQLVGAATVDGQAGLATSEVDQTTVIIRGTHHRRPGLRAAESRRDGSVVYVTGRALRARQCAVDEQLGIFVEDKGVRTHFLRR